MSTSPGQNNTYVPEVSAKLVVDFSRSKDKFPLNEYVQIVPVKKEVGYYTKMDREEAGRVMATDAKGDLWAGGAPRPSNNGRLEGHEFKAYGTKRYETGFNIDGEAVDQANWDVVAHQANVASERTMRRRTQLVVTQATTSGNYDSTHVSAVASITGNTGKWDVSTTARSDIKRSLDYAAEKAIMDSLNGVSEKDLIVVINLDTARKIAVCQEIVDYMKGSYVAPQWLQGSVPGMGGRFRIPKELYGYKLVVEDTVKVTSRKGAASKTISYILGAGTAFMCSRVGGLESKAGPEAPSFSTHSLFVYEDFTVEQRRVDWDRQHQGSVVDNIVPVVTAPVAGFLFTSTND